MNLGNQRKGAVLEERIIYEKLIGYIPIHLEAAEKIEEVDSILPSKNMENGQKTIEMNQIEQYMAEICHRLDIMESTRENLAWRPIYSCRKFIGWLIVFLKRVVRKCLKWYLEPVCFQQTDFNNAVTPAIGRLTELQQLSIDRMQDLEDSLAKKETEQEQRENELRKSLSAQIDTFKNVAKKYEQLIYEKIRDLEVSLTEKETEQEQRENELQKSLSAQIDTIKNMEQKYEQLLYERIQDLEVSLAEKETKQSQRENELWESLSVQVDTLRNTEKKYEQLLYERMRDLEVSFAEKETKQEQRENKLRESLSAQIDMLKNMEEKYEKLLQEQIEKIQQQEQISQAHSSDIGKLTVEHNGRLDALENHFIELESHYNNRISDTERLLQELEEGGVFSSIKLDGKIRRGSLSQAGEDTILAYIFMVLGIEESKCSYLDLGANHAKMLSNTYYFYQKGSRGVLVEANPKLIAELKFYRSGDVVLNRCIATESGQNIDFYVMSGDGLSTPDRKQAEEIAIYNPAIQIEDIVTVQTITVNEILDTYFDGDPVFINIDLEGVEMDILNSIDFEAHRPLAIILEMIPYRHHLVVGIKNQEILQFMTDNDYVEYAFTGINSIFLDKRQMKKLGVLE